MKLSPEVLADKHLLNNVLRSKRNRKHKDTWRERNELTHETANRSRANLSRITRTSSRVFYNGDE
jgi:hypothetical protein